jgi:hypothetical protein
MKYYGIQNEVKAYANRLQSEQGIAISSSDLKALNDRVEALKKSGVWSRFSLGFNDVDGYAYLSRAGVTDILGRAEVLWFTRGMKALDLWSSMVSWPMRSYQNKGTASTVYSLGGFGVYDGTMTNSPSWSVDGITFAANTQYIQYSPNFAVNFTKGGYSVYAVWSGMGVAITSNEGAFVLFGSSDNVIQNVYTTGVGGGTTWQPQSRNYNGNRYFNAVTQSVIGNIAFGWNANRLILQKDGVDLSMGSQPSSTPTNGSYTMRTIGRNNTTASATSRVSCLLVFSPDFQMDAAKNLLIHNLVKSTIGNGLTLA